MHAPITEDATERLRVPYASRIEPSRLKKVKRTAPLARAVRRASAVAVVAAVERTAVARVAKIAISVGAVGVRRGHRCRCGSNALQR